MPTFTPNQEEWLQALGYDETVISDSQKAEVLNDSNRLTFPEIAVHIRRYGIDNTAP